MNKNNDLQQCVTGSMGSTPLFYFIKKILQKNKGGMGGPGFVRTTHTTHTNGDRVDVYFSV